VTEEREATGAAWGILIGFILLVWVVRALVKMADPK
jgi:hypothetical protein